MSRELILNGAVGDTRQIKAFDTAPVAAALLEIQRSAIVQAREFPELIALDASGVSSLESSLVPLAFEALVGGLWEQLVAAYRRGAGVEAGPMPTTDLLLDRPADELAELLDGLRMRGLREQLHERAWAFASKVTQQARRVASLSREGAA